MVASVAGAALGAASFGCSIRIRSILPSLLLGVVALVFLPVMVLLVVVRDTSIPIPRAIATPVIASFLGYFAALALCYLAWLAGCAT
jgi:hypothetical protein